jgi:hypothetical protein
MSEAETFLGLDADRSPMRPIGSVFHILSVVSIGYSLFVWFWTIEALKWGPRNNQAGLVVGMFGIFGGGVQLMVALILTVILLVIKQSLFGEKPSPAAEIAYLNAGWILSAVAVLVVMLYVQ